MKLGIDIGGSHISIALVEKDKILDKTEYIYDKEFRENIRENLVNYIVLTSMEKIKNFNIEKIGISIAGRLEENVLKICPNIQELNGMNLVEEISKYINLPISINKDSLCAAKAEKEYGALNTYKTAVFLCIGTGIGGASFRDNFLHRDGFGHMIIKPDGRKCGCGKKGCFEAYCSIKNLRNRVNNYVKEELEGEKLHDYLLKNQNEPEIKEIIDEYVKYLAIGLSNIIDIVLPEAIAFGGSFSYYEDIFMEKVKRYIIENDLLVDKNSMPIFEMCYFKNDAGILGATL